MPSTAVPYGVRGGGLTTVNYNYACAWANSYVRKWLNSYNNEHGLTITAYKNKKGFKSCLPQGFIDLISKVSSDTFFLLTLAQSFAEADTFSTNSGVAPGTNTGTAWEYWVNRIGTIQSMDQTKIERRVYFNHDRGKQCTYVVTPSIFNVGTERHIQCVFSNGQLTRMYSDNLFGFLPACYIG